MSKDRFSKLERQRPDQPDEPGLQRSRRFSKIEPRKPDAPAPVADRFAPPPEDGSPLEVNEDDRSDAKRLHAERDARAHAHLVDEAAALMIARSGSAGPRSNAKRCGESIERAHRDELVPRARFTFKQYCYIAGGGLVAIAILAQLFGVYVWGLAPILLIGVFVGMLAEA